MKKIIFFIFILFISNIFNSCSDELITIVDEYNPPYEVKVIPGNQTISINFWSGILADDFVGFNLYADTTPSFTNAILNQLDNSYPTVRVDTHTRSNFTLTIPGTYNNDTLYYVAVTAFGTNNLAPGEKIETKVNAISVVPRQEDNNQGNFTVTGTSTVTAAGVIKSYGYQTNFNAITVFTNNNTSTGNLSYVAGTLYIALNGTTLSKLWIDLNGNLTSASHNQGNVCNTI